VQPFLIAYDSELYYNLDAKPLQVELTDYVAQERPIIECKIETKDFSDRTQKRIAGFLRKKLDFICNDMRNSSQGTRHPQIARCIDILEKLHYLPEIESEIVTRLKNSIAEMYGSENEAKRSNAFRSFDAIYKNIAPRKCSKIEAIINGAEILAI
jgi:23S rRNA U2552 (ribose-2'-O)-methylase RlmE/FtsJ